MTDPAWTDRIVGERMAVDQEFSSEVAASRFSSQEWSLIMTATTFEIENPTDLDRARLVANTDQVEQILPELKNIRSQVGAMGGAGGGAGAGAGAGGTPPSGGSQTGGGLIGSLKRALGFGGGGDSSKAEREAADRLTQAYADRLQETLESKGRWESVCAIAADEASATDDGDGDGDGDGGLEADTDTAGDEDGAGHGNGTEDEGRE